MDVADAGCASRRFLFSVLGKLAAGTPSFETFGGPVIPTDRQVELFAKGGFGGAIAIPSYITHWLRRAHSLQKEGRIGPLSHFAGCC